MGTPGDPARWLQVQVAVRREDLPGAETLLEGLGALVTWTENEGSAPVLEPGPGETPLWARTRLTGLFPPDLDEPLLRAAIAASLPGSGPVESSWVADRDWDAEWRRQLKPLRFGRRLWVCPGDESCPEPGAVAIRLDPGMAFGTGTHPSTALCLEWLEGQSLAGCRVLDYGCGSGILAVAALALGGAAATAVDNDPQALRASRENGDRNGCADRLTVQAPGELPREAVFDVVVANILSGILMGLAPELRAHGAPGTRVALSGILADQAEEVRAAYGSWIPLQVTGERDGWVLLTGQVPR